MRVYIAGHRPDFAALVGGPALKLDLPTCLFEHREYWFTDQQPKTGDSTVQNTSTRTEAVQLLEDGRIEELAALLDSSGGPNSPGDSNTTVDVLKPFAAQHNRQRSAQSIADIRHEVRWEKSGATAAVAGEDALWLVVGDGTDVGPLVHALTADGCRHRVIEIAGFRHR